MTDSQVSKDMEYQIIDDVIEISSPELEGVAIEIRRDPHVDVDEFEIENAVTEAADMLRSVVAETTGFSAFPEIQVLETVLQVPVTAENGRNQEENKNLEAERNFQRAADLVGYPPAANVEGGPLATITGRSQSSQKTSVEVVQSKVEVEESEQYWDEKPSSSQPPRRRGQKIFGWLASGLDEMRRDRHELPKNPTRLQRFQHSILCPPYNGFATSVTVLLLLATLWGMSFAILGVDFKPGSGIFELLLLLTTALIAGQIVSFIRLPPLLGMLLVGLAWRNIKISGLDFDSQINPTWSYILRNLAMVIIILRGGFGLNLLVLKRHWKIILRLSLLPSCVEATSWAIGAYLLLHFNWIWGFLLGFVISAASAAVVIPYMLRFQEEGLGVDKGVPTMTIAATGIDNVLAMAAFGIIHGIAFSDGHLLESIGNVPAQIVVGTVFGLGWGMILRYFPSSDIAQGYVIAGRLALVLAGGVIAVLGGHTVGYSGAGPLACLILSLIANVSWRSSSGWGKSTSHPVTEILAGLWKFFEPLLFGLIGSQITLGDLNPEFMGYGILILFLALFIRVLSTLLAVSGSQLTWRECLFVAVAWIPKATVQAALGPVMLETSRKLNLGVEVENMGRNILSLAAFSILITAPLGALAMELVGPRLLNKKVVPRSTSGVTEVIASGRDGNPSDVTEQDTLL